jgi:hypothetical protein
LDAADGKRISAVFTAVDLSFLLSDYRQNTAEHEKKGK